MSRLALRSGGPTKTAALLADTLGYGLVGVWLEQDGWIRLADGHGYAAAPVPVRVESDATLVKVLQDGTTQRVQRPADAPLWMGAASEVIAAPLDGSGTARGILVLGQPARPFSGADLAIAPSLAECVGLAQTQGALPSGTAPVGLPAPAALTHSVGPTATAPPPAATSAPVTASAAQPAATARARRGWVLPLFLLALVAAGVGAVFGEPLVFVLAGLLLLVAVWGSLA